jgi:N-methylhydantoinase A
VELVNLRVIAIGQIPKPHLPEITHVTSLADAHKGWRSVWFRGSGFVEAAIYERGKLPVGVSFEGPAVVEQPDTTTVMPPGTLCTPDKYGNLVIKVER